MPPASDFDAGAAGAEVLVGDPAPEGELEELEPPQPARTNAVKTAAPPKSLRIAVLLAIVVFLAIHFFPTRTYFGKAIRGVSQDHEAAAWMGINTGKVCLVSFALGVMLAAFPGVVIALQTFNPIVSFGLTNKALIVLVLAGVGSLKGVLAAGFLLGAFEAVSVFFVGAPYREVAGLVLFVLVLMVRPEGLGGRWQ